MKHYPNHVGVWLDHHQAHLVYPKGKDEYAVETLVSPHDNHPRYDGETSTDTTFGRTFAAWGSNNEHNKHQREQKELHDYYRMLQKVLAQYDEILLFGPTTAKEELYNILFDDKAFNGKRISVEKSDKMTGNQLLAYVREYFSEQVRN